MRIALLACVLTLAGCWAFERTDDRPAPVVDALQEAAAAYEVGQQQAPPIPGMPGWLLGVLFGGTAAVSAFVTRLVSRKQELDAGLPKGGAAPEGAPVVPVPVPPVNPQPGEVQP